MLPPTSQGFTIIELLFTMAVAVILLSVGIPSFQSLMQNSRVTAQANEFVTAVHTARSEAIKRDTPVALCASTDAATCAGSNNWASGWIIFTDSSGTAGTLNGTDTLLRSYKSLGGQSTLSAPSTNFVRYLQTGALAGSAVNFTLQAPGCSGDEVRSITISPQGHVRVQLQSC